MGHGPISGVTAYFLNNSLQLHYEVQLHVKKYPVCQRTIKGTMYMWKHFMLINQVGAGLAELIYEHQC